MSKAKENQQDWADAEMPEAPQVPEIAAVPEAPQAPPETVTVSTQWVVMVLNALNGLGEVPKGFVAGDMRMMGNVAEGVLREAGVIKE